MFGIVEDRICYRENFGEDVVRLSLGDTVYMIEPEYRKRREACSGSEDDFEYAPDARGKMYASKCQCCGATGIGTVFKPDDEAPVFRQEGRHTADCLKCGYNVRECLTLFKMEAHPYIITAEITGIPDPFKNHELKPAVQQWVGVYKFGPKDWQFGFRYFSPIRKLYGESMTVEEAANQYCNYANYHVPCLTLERAEEIVREIDRLQKTWLADFNKEYGTNHRWPFK